MDTLHTLSYTTTDLRSQFLLDPEVLFFNHGSQGACPRPVFEAYQRWQLEFERQPIAFGREHGGAIHEARRALADYLGAETDNLVYVVNATMGINIVARSLSLEADDEILMTDHEYGAIERTWVYNCKCGAEVIHQPVSMPIESPEQVVEAIWAGVTPRTKVLAVSHITSPTAWILPMAELCRRARAEGILTVIDGAHAPGQIPLALDDLDVDFYIGNCHKWMMTPKGSAFLYARPEVQDLLEPLVVSWGWGNDVPRVTPFVDTHQVQGTRDISAFLAVPEAIAFMEEHDWDAVRARCHDLLRYAEREICAFTGLDPITSGGGRWYAQMASIPLPPCDTGALKTWLYDEHHIEIPIVTWQERPMARLSVQGYNTREEVDILIETVKAFFA
jgi:isopenicillin-N epimerase